MTPIVAFLRLTWASRVRRVIGLSAFGTLFVVAGATARLMTAGEHGHVELDPLFELGGTTLVSALLVLGWLVGRFPMIATLVLMQGAFSADRAAGTARLYAVRPRSLPALYLARTFALLVLAWLLSAIVLPLFDFMILGAPPGPEVFILITAQVLAYGAVTALLSVFTRADAWIALFLGIAAVVWDALRRMDAVASTLPWLRDAVSVLLPPQGALIRIESAFGADQPIPSDAFLYVTVYAALVFLLTAVALSRRQI